ncbi:hypothetical protein OAJ30_02630 [Alphaproteobacteria bacterium]|nr:hypothetical protein [Alphaproteobacteria bacterium]
MNNSKNEHLKNDKLKQQQQAKSLQEKKIAEEKKLSEKLREEHKDIPFLFAEEKKLTNEKEINNSVDSLIKCPFCAEKILKEALKCKHCGEFINKKEKTSYTWDKNKNKLIRDTSVPNSKKIEITNNYTVYLVVLVIIVFAAGYWISKGTPDPTLFFTANDAKRECLSLANKNKGIHFLINNQKIVVNDTWIKNGKRVVQLVQGNNNNLNRIMCTYGNGIIEIPSILEQGKWR